MDVRTLCEIFYTSVARQKVVHLEYKQAGRWHGISSAEFLAAVEELSMGLRELGVERGERVAILSENRPEWAVADLATLCAGAVDAPIYATLTPLQVLHVLKDSQSKVCFVSSAAQAQKIAEVRAQAPQLQHVIRMDEAAIPDTLSLADVRARGRAALQRDPSAVRTRVSEVQPSDLATLIYTSGTTGEPKGVMLLHSNLVSNVIAGSKALPITPDDVCLSFLPLCHIFERTHGHYLMLYKGVTIAYAESVATVPENMGEVRPTLMLSVPRLYEKMHARVLEKVANDSPVRQKIFHWALHVGRRYFKHRVNGTIPGIFLGIEYGIADALVFGKIKARLGGRIKAFVSGGAPLSREIAEFFGAAGITILEGYGLTETSPVITVNRPERLRPGTVGPAVEGVEVRIAADGEILTRGPHVMKGYYNQPAATAEVIDADGWFHTGDIGRLDADGFLTITDRKKDIIVTSGGKNIAPQPIESRIKAQRFFAEVVMIGNKRNFASALVIPNFEVLEAWAQERRITFRSREDLIAKPEVVELYERLLQEATPDLAQFETIKKITLLAREFTLENGELTPTLKVKRRFVEQKYKDVIDRMYAGSAA